MQSHGEDTQYRERPRSLTEGPCSVMEGSHVVVARKPHLPQFLGVSSFQHGSPMPRKFQATWSLVSEAVCAFSWGPWQFLLTCSGWAGHSF